MGKFQFFVILILSGWLSVTTLSQVTRDDVDEWNRQDQEKRWEAIREASANSIPKPHLFEKLIGPTDESWVVSLITEGGIFGTRTLKNINSEGKLLCQATDEQFLTHDVASDRFGSISSLVPQLFNKKFVFETKSAARIKYCSDCSYQSVVLHRREKGSIVSHKFPLADGSSVISDLYDKISVLDGCQSVKDSGDK